MCVQGRGERAAGRAGAACAGRHEATCQRPAACSPPALLLHARTPRLRFPRSCPLRRAGAGHLQAAGVGVQPPEHHPQRHVQAQAQPPGHRPACAGLGRPAAADAGGAAAARRHAAGAPRRRPQIQAACPVLAGRGLVQVAWHGAGRRLSPSPPQPPAFTRPMPRLPFLPWFFLLRPRPSTTSARRWA